MIKLCGYFCGVIPIVGVFIAFLAGLHNILKQYDLNGDGNLILNSSEVLSTIGKVIISLFIVWIVSFLILLFI